VNGATVNGYSERRLSETLKRRASSWHVEDWRAAWSNAVFTGRLYVTNTRLDWILMSLNCDSVRGVRVRHSTMNEWIKSSDSGLMWTAESQTHNDSIHNIRTPDMMMMMIIIVTIIIITNNTWQIIITRCVAKPKVSPLCAQPYTIGAIWRIRLNQKCVAKPSAYVVRPNAPGNSGTKRSYSAK